MLYLKKQNKQKKIFSTTKQESFNVVLCTQEVFGKQMEIFVIVSSVTQTVLFIKLELMYTHHMAMLLILMRG